MKWNKVIYADCMNEVNGLPTLEDKSVDLCLTDPPYNKKFDGFNGYNQKYKKKTILYFDNMKPQEYHNWCSNWFNELKRICNNIIISVGINNLNMWYKIDYVDDIYYRINWNGKFGSRIAYFNKIEPWLFFGQCSQQFNMNVFDDTKMIKKHNFLHPCPRSERIVENIIRNFSPESVLDPFLGSGTTAEVCTKLGIPWFGYELNEVYSQDIDKRLKGCKREPKQVGLEVFNHD